MTTALQRQHKDRFLRRTPRRRGICCTFALWIGLQCYAVVPPLKAESRSLPNTGDPLQSMAMVRQLGQPKLERWLTHAPSTHHRLFAVRTVVHWTAPEGALPALARCAAGRDPHIAPAAMEFAWRVVAGLDMPTLAARETLRSPLHKAQRRFATLARDRSLRADLRATALAIATRLHAFRSQ